MSAFPLVLSSPSGGGKTTIARKLLATRTDVGYSVSCTTRAPRPGEAEGRDYFFLSRDDFVARRSRGDFAESAEVHGNLYGTLREQVTAVLGKGRNVIVDIDVQGARQFAEAFPDSVLVFLLPPSVEALLGRLSARQTEARADFVRRVRGARQELMAVSSYEYVVVNDDLNRAYAMVSSIVDSESVRRERMSQLHENVERLIADLDRELLRLTTT